MFQSRFVSFSVVILVAVASVSAFAILRPQTSANARTNQPTITSTATIDKGNLTLTVSATGSFATAQSSNLAFEVSSGASSVVTSIAVQPGQHVEAGQTLATVDDSSEQSAVKQAQLNLQAAQAALDKVLEPVDPNTVALAQADVTSAKGALQAKASTVTQSDVSVYQSRLQEAQAAKADADNLLKDTGGQYPTNDPNYQLALAQDGAANFNVEIAQLNLQEAEKGTPLGAAQANIALSQAKLAQTAAGPTQIDIDTAQAAVATAQIQLDLANYALAKATLTAPYAGVISAVDIKVGQAAQGTAMVITDLGSLYASVNVDEADITSIASGQKVSFTVDALPGVTITGTVDRVMPIADSTAAVITYPVNVKLDSATQPILPGMTLNATFTVKQVNNVVRIPNNYLRVDSTGQTTANLVNAAGGVIAVPVKVGVQGADYTEVLQGLTPGDTVALVTQAAQQSS